MNAVVISLTLSDVPAARAELARLVPQVSAAPAMPRRWGSWCTASRSAWSWRTP